MRAKDQEHLTQIKAFIKQEHDILSKIIKDYGSLEDVANRSSETTRKHLSILTEKENVIVAKVSQIPDSVKIRHLYGVDLKSTPVVIIMILFSVIISLGLGMLLEKDRQIGDKTSYELRYRMMTLEMPELIQEIDSIYNSNPEKLKIWVKQEEERLLAIRKAEENAKQSTKQAERAKEELQQLKHRKGGK